MNAIEMNLVQRVRRAYAHVTRRRAIERRQSRTDSERYRAEVALLVDDLIAEGVDPRSPMGLECVRRVMAQRHGDVHDARCDEEGLGDW